MSNFKEFKEKKVEGAPVAKPVSRVFNWSGPEPDEAPEECNPVVKNKCTKHNPECVKHTPEWHGPGCVKSGKNKCEDALHIKTCWTREDLEMMCNILDKHIGDNQAT